MVKLLKPLVFKFVNFAPAAYSLDKLNNGSVSKLAIKHQEIFSNSKFTRKIVFNCCIYVLLSNSTLKLIKCVVSRKITEENLKFKN